MKEIIAGAKTKMEKCISSLEYEFSTIRAGRANPSVLDKIMVDYYGVPTAINAMAAVSVPEARILLIQPWYISALKTVEKAILASDIGITPQNDGKALRLAFPQLTEERRRELAKQIGKYGEESKVSVRNVRRDAIDRFKAMKKSSEITEDDLKDADKEVQKLTDSFIEKIDKICGEKEKEIMKV